LYEIEKTVEVNRWIEITKSDSGISGPELAIAHLKLGGKLGKIMSFEPKETTIVAIMRGGLFFAEGIYLQTGFRLQTYDPKYQVFQRPNTKHVILVDSVINTGKTIQKIRQPDMIVACCVINEKAISLFGEQLYVVRVSKNSFIGSNVKNQKGKLGPDTTMRLFHLL